MSTLSSPYVLGDLSSVSFIWLTLTNRCNIHCKYCFNYVYRNYESMPDELAVSIVNKHLEHLQLPKQEKFHVIYFGGEPTVNDSALIASIDCIKNQNVSSQLDILTNGLIRPSVLESLLLLWNGPEWRSSPASRACRGRRLKGSGGVIYC
jgi:sulfatase maturation enzyme AslB (radical SAM superfamily)